MPKDEFDFDDPMELSGMGIMTNEDNSEIMAECFIEEYMRMGYSHLQILALFKNPFYIGPNMVLEKKNLEFVKKLIVETFSKWGRSVEWADDSIPPKNQAPAT